MKPLPCSELPAVVEIKLTAMMFFESSQTVFNVLLLVLALKRPETKSPVKAPSMVQIPNASKPNHVKGIDPKPF